MFAKRFKNSSTGINLQSLLTLVLDPNCKKVRLFASPASCTADHADSDGPETNFPLVAALAEYSIPGITEVYVLFDGLFLTAVRSPRLGEVQELLDAAQVSGKTTFAPSPVAFTSSLEPDAAVKVLLAQENMVQLTPQSRKQYFAMLCGVSEPLCASV